MVAEYTTYAEAQAAVDHLSDAGFPVDRVTIVWDGLRHVEHVTGRRTVLNALIEGAATGAWFGGLLGLLLLLFVELDDGTNAVALVVTYIVIGALIVAAWRAAAHWLHRGARDFAAIGRFEARRYQVWVDPDLMDRAAGELGVVRARAIDPQPID